MPLRRSLLPAAFSVLAVACSSVQSDLNRQLLRPPPGWLAEPQDVGITAEPFEIVLHSEASLTGWWMPHAQAHGRTVVLLHDGDTNVSVLHPYYSFLHAAGFSVLAFDPRGFGRSKGTPTFAAWLHDVAAVFTWLRARPEVDRNKIALFGTGLGSVAAMWAGRTQVGCKALVLENLPSLRDMLRESIKDDGSAMSAYRIGMIEFAGLPEDIEPDENAPNVKVPALFLAGENEPLRDRLSLLRAYRAYAGERQLWTMPATGTAPQSMLTHDGEYQRTIVAFLEGAFADRREAATASWKKASEADDGAAWYEIEIAAEPADHEEPWAIEACAVLDDGSAHYTRTWLEGARGSTRIKLPKDPLLVAPTRVRAVVGNDSGGFLRKPSHLSRSAAAVAPLADRIEELRNDKLERPACEQLAADLKTAEAAEPFHPRLENELADVFARLGKALLSSDDSARRAEALTLLARAVAAVPAHPKLHVWPGPTTTYGFPQQAAVDESKRLLEQNRR